MLKLLFKGLKEASPSVLGGVKDAFLIHPILRTNKEESPNPGKLDLVRLFMTFLILVMLGMIAMGVLSVDQFKELYKIIF